MFLGISVDTLGFFWQSLLPYKLLVLNFLLCVFRQLATSAAGVPLFEIFLIVNKKGEHKLKVSILYFRNFHINFQ